MARAIKQGQHIFIAFQDGEAVLDSQLRPRMYKNREQFEKSFPAWRDGKAEIVEYTPTLTPPNEPLTLEELREMNEEPVYLKVFDPLLQSGWHIIKAVTQDKIIFRELQKVYVPIKGLGVAYNLYRCPLKGEDNEKTNT